jgi:hypothetical protein
VGVDVHGRVDIRVSQQLLHILGGRAVGEKIAGEGVPLWHNKDKSENPCVARSWRLVLILFPLKNGLETGYTGGDNQGLHLKDKFFQITKEVKNGFLGHHHERKRLRPGPAGNYRSHSTESGGLLHFQCDRRP